jgi:RES domain-containing protein
MITAWRITQAKYATTAFDGEGARLEGGRWTSPGLSAVYVAGSVALAALEMLVHVDSSILPANVRIPCTFTEALVRRLDRSQLPSNWQSSPAPPELQQLGDRWLNAGASAILEVPSAVVEIESNYLLNPAHPDFRRIQIGEASPFEVDLRLLKGK